MPIIHDQHRVLLGMVIDLVGSGHKRGIRVEDEAAVSVIKIEPRHRSCILQGLQGGAVSDGV